MPPPGQAVLYAPARAPPSFHSDLHPQVRLHQLPRLLHRALSPPAPVSPRGRVGTVRPACRTVADHGEEPGHGRGRVVRGAVSRGGQRGERRARGAGDPRDGELRRRGGALEAVPFCEEVCGEESAGGRGRELWHGDLYGPVRGRGQNLHRCAQPGVLTLGIGSMHATQFRFHSLMHKAFLHSTNRAHANAPKLHIVSQEIWLLGRLLIILLPCHLVDALVLFLCYLKYGDTSKCRVHRPMKGPFYLKANTPSYPVVDVGTLKKIKSGDIQVLPSLASVKGSSVMFVDGKSYQFDAIILATGCKSMIESWLKENDGLAKQKFPNHWKREDGLYCAGLVRRGIYGSAEDAENIAKDISNYLKYEKERA